CKTGRLVPRSIGYLRCTRVGADRYRPNSGVAVLYIPRPTDLRHQSIREGWIGAAPGPILLHAPSSSGRLEGDGLRSGGGALLGAGTASSRRSGSLGHFLGGVEPRRLWWRPVETAERCYCPGWR